MPLQSFSADSEWLESNCLDKCIDANIIIILSSNCKKGVDVFSLLLVDIIELNNI